MRFSCDFFETGQYAGQQGYTAWSASNRFMTSIRPSHYRFTQGLTQCGLDGVRDMERREDRSGDGRRVSRVELVATLDGYDPTPIS